MGGGNFLENRDVCTGFSLYLKTCSSVIFDPNVSELGKADNSDMLFRVISPRLVSKVANWNRNLNLCAVTVSSHQIAVRYIYV